MQPALLDLKSLERAARKRVQLANYHLRRFRQHLDDADIRQFRRFVAMLRHDNPDVVYLGDSTVSLVSPTDTDRRPLHQMVADGLGSGIDTYSLHGASYQPGMYRQFLRALSASRCRPVIVVPLCTRLGTLPWNRHPYFARRESIEFMQAVDLTAPLRTFHAAFPRPTRDAYAKHMARVHPTWAGTLTVGEYVRPLTAPKSAGLDTAAAERLRYAYHHGGVVERSYLDSVEAMASSLRDLGCPTVIYQTPVPVNRGAKLFGEPFRELAEGNFAAMERAYCAGFGSEVAVLQTGTSCGTEDFLDPTDASEHLNEQGRSRVAEQLVGRIGAALRPSP